MSAATTAKLPFADTVTLLDMTGEGSEKQIASADLPDGFYAGNPTWVAGPFTSVIDAAEYLRDTETYHGDFVVAVNRAAPEESMEDSRPQPLMDFSEPEPRTVIAVAEADGVAYFGPADDLTNPAVAHFIGTLNRGSWSTVEVKPFPGFITHPQSGVGHPKAEPCTPACSTPKAD